MYGGKVLAYSDGSIVDFWIHGFFYNLTHLYDPADGLWYLVSLYFWRLFLNCSDRVFQNKIPLHLGLALVTSLFAGFVPIGREMSFQRTFAFYPLFVLGYYLRDYYEKLRNIPRIIPIGVIFVYVVIVVLNDVPPIRILLQRIPYNISHLLSSILGRCFFYVWVVPVSLSVIAAFPDIKYFAQEGSRTLFYYMYHMFFVLLFRYMVVNTSLECDLLTVFAYATASFFVMRQMRKVPLFTFLTSTHVPLRKS